MDLREFLNQHKVMFSKAYEEQPILKNMIEFYTKESLPNLLILSGSNLLLKYYTVFSKIAPHHLCLNQNDCGECKSCLLLEKQEHPDLILLPEDKMKIGDPKAPEIYSVRWLQRNILPYKPNLSKVRLIIIPSAEKMGWEAEVALLKTLEEPNVDTKFIFFTPNLDSLKDTIISRGVVISVKHFSLKQMNQITQNNQYEYLEIFGGSLDQFYQFSYEIYKDIKQQILNSMQHPIDFLEFEQWIINFYQKHYEDSTSEIEFWEFFTNIYLQCIRRSVHFKEIANYLLEFLIGLRAEQSGLLPYLLNRLFFQLYRTLFVKIHY